MYTRLVPFVVRGVDKGGLLVTKHKPSLNSNDKEGFLRAFTDEWLELQIEYRVVLEFTVEPSLRKGILRFTVTALDPDNGRATLSSAYYQCEYPTAAVQSVEACMFACMVKLERILRDRRTYPLGKA